jgi:hypothetical protein
MRDLSWESTLGVKQLRQLQKYKHSESHEYNAQSFLLRDGLSLERLTHWRQSKFRFMEIDRRDQGCSNEKCPRYGYVSADIGRAVVDLRPTICRACGYLLVPTEIVQALQGAKRV